MIESNKKKETPSRVTKENRTEQKEKSRDERSELKTGSTRTKKSSQQEKAGVHQNGKGRGDVDRSPHDKTQDPIQACLARDAPPEPNR
jgi:hypothetical protein